MLYNLGAGTNQKEGTMKKQAQEERDSQIEKHHQEIVKLLAEKNPKNNARLDELRDLISDLLHLV